MDAAASNGITPDCACARASAASKASIQCTVRRPEKIFIAAAVPNISLVNGKDTKTPWFSSDQGTFLQQPSGNADGKQFGSGITLEA
jgi:hypothetical protein